MKNHELLNLIGDVNEDYVLEAGSNVVKPRFRWKTIAACAACAALVLGACPVYRAVNPPLHSYTVLEGGTLTTEGDLKAPAGEIDVSDQGQPGNIQPGGAYIGDGTGGDKTGDVPVQEHAADQYDKLMKGMGMYGENAADAYPDWFAGAWIDWETLHVAIVGNERNAELEEQVKGWCGDDVSFQYAKYSHAYLDSLMDPVTDALDGSGLSCGIGVDVTANCLGVDLYSNGQTIPDGILAKLAQLDPDGDAIRARLFTGTLDTLTDEIVKGPAPDPVAPEERTAPAVTEDGEPIPTPVDGGKVYHGEDVPEDAVPGGARPAEELPQTKGEDIQPARHDLLPLGE